MTKTSGGVSRTLRKLGVYLVGNLSTNKLFNALVTFIPAYIYPRTKRFITAWTVVGRVHSIRTTITAYERATRSASYSCPGFRVSAFPPIAAHRAHV